MTNGVPHFAGNTLLVVTFQTSAHLKQNSSLNWMDSLRSQHLNQEEYDEERTKYLELQGYKVIRLWNNDVMKDIESVIRTIIYALEIDIHS